MIKSTSFLDPKQRNLWLLIIITCMFTVAINASKADPGWRGEALAAIAVGYGIFALYRLWKLNRR